LWSLSYAVLEFHNNFSKNQDDWNVPSHSVSPTASSPIVQPAHPIEAENMVISVHPVAEPSKSNASAKSMASSQLSSTSRPIADSFRWFLSYRMMTASMLCLCFARSFFS
jgi:hypothetical protein